MQLRIQVLKSGIAVWIVAILAMSLPFGNQVKQGSAEKKTDVLVGPPESLGKHRIFVNFARSEIKPLPQSQALACFLPVSSQASNLLEISVSPQTSGLLRAQMLSLEIGSFYCTPLMTGDFSMLTSGSFISWSQNTHCKLKRGTERQTGPNMAFISQSPRVNWDLVLASLPSSSLALDEDFKKMELGI